MKVRTPRAGLRGAMVTEGAEVADWMFGVFIVFLFWALRPFTGRARPAGRRRGVGFRGDPPWAPRREAAQVKGEEARNKLNTTSRPAPRHHPPDLPRLEARGVLTGHTDQGVGGVPRDGVGHWARFEASPGVSAVCGRREAGGLGRAKGSRWLNS